MTSFHQKMDSVKESLASLFKSRRSRHRSRCSSGSSGSSISTPQNVKRVMHVTFDAQKRSFDGIPADWRPYFDVAAAASAAATSTVHEEESGAAAAESRDDSGVSMATAAAATTESTDQQQPLPAPKELLSLTYDRGSGRFVDLPSHWQDRLQRNNLLTPEFQKNPDLLVAIFALMDQELRAMQLEGFSLDRAMYSSSPTTTGGDSCCDYVYEIEADRSNSSSEQDLPPAIEGTEDDDGATGGFGARRPSLVWMRAVSAPSSKQP